MDTNQASMVFFMPFLSPNSPQSPDENHLFPPDRHTDLPLNFKSQSGDKHWGGSEGQSSSFLSSSVYELPHRGNLAENLTQGSKHLNYSSACFGKISILVSLTGIRKRLS